MSGGNPAQHTSVPKGRAGEETPVYELKGAQKVIFAIMEPESTIYGAAAYSGLRLSEILALHWEDYDGATLRITTMPIAAQLLRPKAKASQADVSVISRNVLPEAFPIKAGDDPPAMGPEPPES